MTWPKKKKLDGRVARNAGLPENIDTKDKIYISIRKSIPVSSHGNVFLDIFELKLIVIYSYINMVATDMDTDVVAKFFSKKNIPLGYFYQGEYHLWEK